MQPIDFVLAQYFHRRLVFPRPIHGVHRIRADDSPVNGVLRNDAEQPELVVDRLGAQPLADLRADVPVDDLGMSLDFGHSSCPKKGTR
jgi:hypothetical protein